MKDEQSTTRRLTPVLKNGVSAARSVNGRVGSQGAADWMIVVVNIGVGDMCDVRVSTPTKPDRVLVAACIRPGERYDMTATLPGKRIDPNRMRLDEIARSEYGSSFLVCFLLSQK